jgi:hypothetical protein
MIDKYQRMQELRAEDPCGLRSGNQLERKVDVEMLQEQIFHLDFQYEDLRPILSRIVDLLES